MRPDPSHLQPTSLRPVVWQFADSGYQDLGLIWPLKAIRDGVRPSRDGHAEAGSPALRSRGSEAQPGRRIPPGPARGASNHHSCPLGAGPGGCREGAAVPMGLAALRCADDAVGIAYLKDIVARSSWPVEAPATPAQD